MAPNAAVGCLNRARRRRRPRVTRRGMETMGAAPAEILRVIQTCGIPGWKLDPRQKIPVEAEILLNLPINNEISNERQIAHAGFGCRLDRVSNRTLVRAIDNRNIKLQIQ